VRDSAATLILVPHSGYRSPGTDFTIECARKYGKPCYIIWYLDDGALKNIKNVIFHLRDDQSLNIAGPRESEHPGAYERCLAILIQAFD
jgi:Circularly permutated YpsA SLOG family